MKITISLQHTNLCRLCKETRKLYWVFGKKMEKMPKIIHQTTGVKINKNDTISQMVCATCCQVTIKMYQFRTKSIKNDKDLKARRAGFNVAKMANAAVSTNTPSKSSTPSGPKLCNRNVHFSVKEIKAKYPKIILPRECLKSHLGAYITLVTDEIEDYLQEHNLTYGDVGLPEVKTPAVTLPKKTQKRKHASPEAGKTVPLSLGSDRKKVKISNDMNDELKVADTSKNSNNEKHKKTGSVKNITEKLNGISEKVGDSKKRKKKDEQVGKRNSTLSLESTGSSQESEKSSEKCFDRSGSKEASETAEKSQNRLSVDSVRSSKESSNSKRKVKVTKDVSTEDIKAVASITKSTEDSKVAASVTKSTEYSKVVASVTKSTENSKIVANVTESTDDSKVVPSVSKSTKDSKVVTNVTKSTEESDVVANVTKEINPTPPTSSVVKLVANPPESESNTSTSTLKSILENPVSEPAPVTIPDFDKLLPPQPTISIPPNHFKWFTSNTFLDKNQSATVHEDDDDVIIVVDDNPNNTKLSESETKKSTFVEALQLAPKADNQPDLSLVSLATKTHPLYTCRVCDSQHTSLFGLKNHERRNHTRCPFCKTRFRTLAGREEHLITWCQRAPLKMKKARLVLSKIDQDEKVRQMYPRAFGSESGEKKNCKEKSVVNEKSASVPESANGEHSHLLEQLLDTLVSEDKSEKSESPVTTLSEEMISLENLLRDNEEAVQKKVSDKPSRDISAYPNTEFQDDSDIVCISDEELEARKATGERKINIVNYNIPKDFNNQDTDLKILKRILSGSIDTTDNKVSTNFSDWPIVDGDGNRTKVFKNLRQYLRHYQVPIEVKYGPELSVEYKPRTKPPVYKTTRSWTHLTPIQLKPHTLPAKITTGQLPLSNIPSNTPQQVVPSTAKNQNLPSTVCNIQPKTDLPTTLLLTPVSVPGNTVATTSAPLILNQNLSAYKKFLLLPSSFTSTQQTVFSRVQSVTTTSTFAMSEQPSLQVVEQLASITNALMPPTSTITNPNVILNSSNLVNGHGVGQNGKVTTSRPHIRVKDIKDLS